MRCCPLARRGAHTLAWMLCGFAALQLLTSFTADYLEPGLRDPEFGRKLTFLQAQRQAQPDRPLLVLLGSSRTAYGVRADALLPATDSQTPLAYNFGVLAGGPIYELLCFRRLLSAGIRPRWIVLEIHPGFLNVVPNLMLAHRPAIERCDARDMCALHDYVDHPWQAWLEWLRYRSAVSYQLRADLMRRMAPGWVPEPAVPDVTALDKTKPDGWVPLPWPRPDAALRKQRAQWGCEALGAAYQNFQISDRTNRALREILDGCRLEQIHISLLLMPEADEIRDDCARLAQREVFNYLSRLCDEYDAPLIDATHWCADEDFADGQHLLPDAGTRFAQRLGGEVLGDWINSTQPLPETAGPALMAGQPRHRERRR